MCNDRQITINTFRYLICQFDIQLTFLWRLILVLHYKGLELDKKKAARQLLQAAMTNTHASYGYK